MSLKHKIIDEIIRVEGGYVNDPSDSGGETKYGITIAVARRYGYRGRMIDMPRKVAFAIYSALYWDILNLDDVEKLAPAVAEELADSGVNVGVNRAGKWLQRSLNALNNRQKLWQDIAVDGKVGPMTIGMFKAHMRHRPSSGALILKRALNSLQGAFYLELAEKREKDEKFVAGWLLNRVN